MTDLKGSFSGWDNDSVWGEVWFWKFPVKAMPTLLTPGGRGASSQSGLTNSPLWRIPGMEQEIAPIKKTNKVNFFWITIFSKYVITEVGHGTSIWGIFWV